MKLSTISLALCFALAPFAAQAKVDQVPRHHTLHQMERYAIPQTATAFVPAVKLDDDSDGLSRNIEDCNRGCIDN